MQSIDVLLFCNDYFYCIISPDHIVFIILLLSFYYIHILLSLNIVFLDYLIFTF